MKKKKIVENDKKKIEEVIKELDEKKNEALKIASTKVNKVRSLCLIHQIAKRQNKDLNLILIYY